MLVPETNTRVRCIIATTSVSTGSEPLGEPETGEQRGAMAVLFLLTYLLTYLLTHFSTRNGPLSTPSVAA